MSVQLKDLRTPVSVLRCERISEQVGSQHDVMERKGAHNKQAFEETVESKMPLPAEQLRTDDVY